MALKSATINVMEAAARKAGRGLIRDFGEVEQLQVSRKGPADFVSSADRKAESILRKALTQARPDYALLMEESGATEGRDSRHRWIVDPLDGTTNFLHEHPQYCSSVAVAVEGRPVAGAVVSGSSGERWWASEGAGAYKSGKRISVSTERPLIEALVGTGFPFKLLDVLPTYLGQLDRVLRSASGVRRAGSAALDLCYLAQGSLDAFWEEILMPWDFAAGLVIVREAGGVLSLPDGDELRIETCAVRGANRRELLEELRSVLEG